MTKAKQAIFRAGEGPTHRVRPGLWGTLIEGEKVTLVRWEVPPGRAPTPIHSHAEHEQYMILMSGSLETTVGGETIVMREGDILRIEKTVPHGGTRVLGEFPAIVIDVFSPPREDYLAAVRQESGQ